MSRALTEDSPDCPSPVLGTDDPHGNNKHPLESQVNSYCQIFPAVFNGADGAEIVDKTGRKFLDFFSGAGTLNYGHNHPKLRKALLDYLASGGIVHALDMATEPRHRFLDRFSSSILKPRGLEYRIQFPGPTGTNAVEAALKLARKFTGRQEILSFNNGFHGVTLGSLAVTSNPFYRNGCGVELPNARIFDYDSGLGPQCGSLSRLEEYLCSVENQNSLPAAAIVEMVQCEGGVHVASKGWLQRLAKILHRFGVLLIVDDIQAGCGRTGDFFSFEFTNLHPDIVCLSKSLSGFGLPLSTVLLRPELDCWEAGEHNGTFRGNCLSLVTATEALSFWESSELKTSIEHHSKRVGARLHGLAERFGEEIAAVRGRGLIYGIEMRRANVARKVAQQAFARNLIIETSGTQSQVLKLLPPLTITSHELERGLQVIEDSIASVRPATIQSSTGNVTNSDSVKTASPPNSSSESTGSEFASESKAHSHNDEPQDAPSAGSSFKKTRQR